MSLDDLMRGQSAMLAKSVTGEIEQDKFVELSLNLAERYVDSYRQEHEGIVGVSEIVANILAYDYNGRADRLLEDAGIVKRDKERHLELSRWYSQFFVKYHTAAQIEGIERSLLPVRGALEKKEPLVDVTTGFNKAINSSRIRHPKKYEVPIPSEDAQRHYSEGPQIKQKPRDTR